MQVYKCYLKIVRQNIGMIAMYLVIFIVLSVSFSNMGADQQLEQYTDTRVNLSVIDRDGSDISRSLTGVLEERHNIVSLPDDTETLRDALYNRDISYALFIPEGYGEALLSGEAPLLENAQIPSSYTGSYVDRLLQSYVSTMQVYLDAGLDVQEAIAHTETDLAVQGEVMMTHAESQEASGIYYFYKYLCYCMLLMMIFGLCPVLMVFGKRDIAMRMESSSLPFRSKNFGLGLGTVTIAVIFYAVFVLFGFLMYGGSMLTSASLICLLNAAAFMVAAAALAFLVGQISTNGNILSAVANVVGLAMCFLGGVFVPLDLMGSTIQGIAKLFPTYWYVHVADLTLGSGGATATLTTEMAQSMGIQLLFAAAFLAIALVISKQRRKVL